MLNEQGNWVNDICGTNLLIIGNGFDLAHNLKTEYMDFLKYAFTNKPDILKIIKRKYTLLDKKTSAKPEFLDILFSSVDNWIDLENNLARCIWSVIGDEMEILTEIFDEFLLPEFEEYIATCINQSEVSPLFNIDIFSQYTDVLSFNYSNTYERLYGKLPIYINGIQYYRQICYINGKAQPNASKSNIVFGCDEFDKDDENVSWFNKVFQRAYKSTDDYYKNLRYKPMSISIIGHSLGKTDHHILEPLITNNMQTQTTVYYHNDDWHRLLIHRMMDMVGIHRFKQGFIEFKDIKEIYG